MLEPIFAVHEVFQKLVLNIILKFLFSANPLASLCQRLSQYQSLFSNGNEGGDGNGNDNGERVGSLFSGPGIGMLESAMSNAAGSSALNYASLLSGPDGGGSLVNKLSLMQMMNPALTQNVPSASSVLLQQQQLQNGPFAVGGLYGQQVAQSYQPSIARETSSNTQSKNQEQG